MANYAYNRDYIQTEGQSLQALQEGTSEDSLGLSLCMIKPVMWIINNNNSKGLVGPWGVKCMWNATNFLSKMKWQNSNWSSFKYVWKQELVAAQAAQAHVTWKD